MKWLMFALVAWVMVGLETGLKPALQLGPTPIAPSFVLPLAVVVAMFASSSASLWACLLLGLMIDLTWKIPRTDFGTATMIGPYALGYLLAGQLVLTLRGIMMRRNPLSVAFLSAAAAIVANVVVVAIITLHTAFYNDPIDWSPPQQLLARLISALYTGLIGLVLAPALLFVAPFMGLQTPGTRRYVKRS